MCPNRVRGLVRRADFSNVAAAGDAPVRTEGSLQVDETGATGALGLCDSLKVGLASVLSPLADGFRWAFGDAWLTVMVIGLPLLLIAAWALARRGRAGRRAPFVFAIADAIDRLNDRMGRFVAWLTLVMVLVTVLIVVLRYGFEIGFIWMQESVRFMHAAVFLLCAGYTLLWNQHVRVDVFYLRMRERGRAAVDLFGTVFFLAPVCTVVVLYSGDYVLNSWAECEGSLEERGVHAVYLLKTCIWIFAATMILQGASRAVRASATLLGLSHGPPEIRDHAL